ncbi:MAG TPA: hypothetical protein VJV79_10505 [Polyangiaceae bacterium]|nr:hypothetical protein [Polyangiaceae bacterium]
MWKRIGKPNLSSLVGLALLLGALPASAADVQAQQVYGVGYSTEFAHGELNVNLWDDVYYADVGVSPGCDISVPSAETVKIWQSLAQSALLSGKTVSIGYTDCGDYHYIRWLSLNG